MFRLPCFARKAFPSPGKPSVVFSGEKFGAKDEVNLFLYVSPTMFRPQSISITREAFGCVFWRKIWGER
jgi:hypothetical protein